MSLTKSMKCVKLEQEDRNWENETFWKDKMKTKGQKDYIIPWFEVNCKFW